jgi:preprotein translocase SecE subunit
VAKDKDTSTTVTRIKASGDTSSKKSQKTSKDTAVATPPSSTKRSVSPFIVFRPFVALGRYFKGAWVELRQVRWPTRGATWSLTGAVLLFTAFFVVMILLLDAGFKYLFEQILG